MPFREFEIHGWDAEKPIHFVARGKAPLSRLIETCSEEMELIDREILDNSIPFPKRMTTLHGKPELEVREAQPKCPLSTLSYAGSGNIPSPDVPIPSSRPRLYWERVRRAAQLVPIGRAVLTIARPGAIVIAGSGWRTHALAKFVRSSGRDVVQCESAYGNNSGWIVSGVLRRPAENSFLAWLSTDATARLGGAGAIVLMDPFNASDDSASLIGLEGQAPPIILPAAQASGAENSIPIGFGYVAIPSGTSLAAASSGATLDWPKITLVTVSFNQARYLEATIRSVLDQNYPALEYIVADGGSTDGSIDIIEKYRSHFAHVIIEPDKGQSDALNKGFRLATGEIMNWLCSDDMIEPGTLARVGHIYRHWKPDLVVGGCVRIRATRQDEIFRHHSALPFGRVMPLPFDDMLQFTRSWEQGHYFFQPEVFFSRRIWEASGAFIKRHLYYAMDYDLWLRMAMAGATVIHAPDIFGCSRVHEAQKTQSDRVYLHQLRQIMEEYKAALVQVSELRPSL